MSKSNRTVIPAQTGYASNDPHNFYYDYATRSSGGHRSHDHHRSGSHGGFNRPSSAGATRKHSSGGYGRSNAGTTNIFVGGRGMGHSGSGHGGSSHREQYARPTTQEQLHQQQQQYYRQQHQQQQMHQQQGAYQNQNPNNVQQQQQFHQQQQYSGSSKQQFSGSGNGPSYPSSNAPNAPTYFGDGGNSGGGAHTRTRPMSAGATMSSGRQQSQQQVKTGGQMPSTAVNVAESVKDANGGSNTTSASGNPTVAAPAAAPITIPTAGVVRPTSASGGGTIKASYKPQNGNVVSAEGSGEDTMEAAGLGEHSGLNGQNQANRQKGSSGEGNFVDDEEEDPELNGSKRRSGKNHPGSIDNSQSRTTHPEVSSTISNLGNGTVSMDIRSVESSFLEDGRVPASIGLTTLPNQFCSINEAIELRKLLLMGNNNARGGIIPSSTAVMDMYMVGKVIGVGSYGKVRAAWHRLTGSKVAIKTYDKAKLKDPAHWKRVHSEIKITEQTSHPRIARLFEAIETPKRMHLIMECLDGGNLCSYVKQKRRLSEDESKRIFFQLVQSIDYLHIMGVAHRDIKLENVLFNDHKDIKLIDFGFSTVCQPGKKLRVFCGTPSYMAPEIVRRVEYEGKPTDMWSMGILLYALLCGCFPFRAKTYPDLYRRIARGTFTVPDELSVSVRDLLRQLLNVEPTTRITAAAALRHPWLQSQFAQAADVNKLRLESTILVSDRATDDIDDVLLKQLVEFGLTENEVVQLVMSKTHTSITTLYYLMLELLVNERRRNGNKKALPSGLNTLRKQGATITHGNNGNSAAMEVHYMTNNGVPVVINSGSSGAGQSVRPKSASAARASSSSSGSSKNGSIGHSSKNGSGDNGLHFNYQQAQQKQQMLQQQISGQNSSNGHGQHAITTGIPQRPLSATAGRRSN